MEAASSRIGAATGAMDRGSHLGAAGKAVLTLATDERLVSKIRQGSDAAFTVLYERYEPRLLSFCRQMLGSRAEAEDAVQQAFINAYKGIVRSDKELQVKPWLYRIARNQSLSMLRSRKQTDELSDGQASLAGLSEQVGERSDLRELLADLSALPAEQREALVLSELGGNSHTDVAEILGCDKDKVKSLVFQARSSLMKSKEARDISCMEVQQQLSVLSGGSLRRTVLRRHVNNCEACTVFRAEVKRQRGAMAIILPVAPSAALEFGAANALAAAKSAAGIGSAAGAGAGGVSGFGSGLATSLGLSTSTIKAAATIAAIGAVGLISAVGVEATDSARRTSDAAEAVTPASPGSQKGGVAATRLSKRREARLTQLEAAGLAASPEARQLREQRAATENGDNSNDRAQPASPVASPPAAEAPASTTQPQSGANENTRSGSSGPAAEQPQTVEQKPSKPVDKPTQSAPSKPVDQPKSPPAKPPAVKPPAINPPVPPGQGGPTKGTKSSGQGTVTAPD